MRQYNSLKLMKTIKPCLYALLFMFSMVIICSSLVFAGDEIHILYDSETRQPELQVGWGFSALVKRGGINILVDTGRHENIFKHNMKKLGYAPQDIDYLIISHMHPDHYGGMKYLLTENPAIVTYLPADFNKADYPASWKLNYVNKHQEIAEGIHIFQTNPDSVRFGIKEELSLAIKTKQGAVIVSGCFHTGWPNLIKVANETISKKVYLMVGGGRFIDLTENELTKLANKLTGLKLENVGLAHCAAGVLPDRIFGDQFGSHSIYSRLGSIISIPD